LPGAIAFWDNRFAMHLEVHDPPGAAPPMRRTPIIG